MGREGEGGGAGREGEGGGVGVRGREGCGHEGEGGVQGVGEKRRRGEKERRREMKQHVLGDHYIIMICSSYLALLVHLKVRIGEHGSKTMVS